MTLGIDAELIEEALQLSGRQRLCLELGSPIQGEERWRPIHLASVGFALAQKESGMLLTPNRLVF